ncbi:hypothetical protein E3T26_14520 [Cryobacterium sp. TMT1-21]|uniref:hypothetical protein n=1 Tax=Cryobacterium sp. TMT1-21 TaxID=1259234 RepID=UPI00106AC019|nr:hypothetical protein [Cryobacterium sp. TMT1-21]TFD09837.1 hypothetical protein E3T26_14520 [Cryobacterium sp. TMT1-21]
MSLFTRYLDAVNAYEDGKKQSQVGRATPMPKTVDQLAAEAETLFSELVTVIVKAEGPSAAGKAFASGMAG